MQFDHLTKQTEIEITKSFILNKYIPVKCADNTAKTILVKFCNLQIL